MAATSAAAHVVKNIIQGADTVLIDTVNRKVRIHYDGVTYVNNRIRSGAITIQLISGNYWKDTNAIIWIKFDSLICTRKKDGKSITLNGSKTITNVSGGLVSKLGTLGYTYTQIIHRIQAPQDSNGLEVTFDNGKTVSWHTDRTRTISLAATTSIGIIPIREYRYTLSGNYSTANNSNLAWWGTNRNGEPFYDAIPTPIVYDESIDWLGPISGEVKITGITKELDITYGVDQNGNPVVNPTINTTLYYKLSWTDFSGKSRTAVEPYL